MVLGKMDIHMQKTKPALHHLEEVTWKVSFFFVFCLFRAAPTAYGDSQARGWIGAVDASLHHRHSNVVSEPHLWPTPQLKAMPDP